MKLLLIFALAFPFLTGNVLAWQIPLSVLDFFAASQIPQFIRDVEHPWLNENRKWLEGLNNATHSLCSLDSDLQPGNGGVTYPGDFYRRLEINNNRAGIERGGWSNARARTREMLGCPAALLDVEEFTVDIYVSDGKFNVGIKEPQDPPSDVPGMFVRLLSSMPNLRLLDWNSYRSGREQLRKAFADVNLTLPSVRHLRPSAEMSFMTRMCPNVEILESGGSSRSGYFGWERDWDPRMELIESANDAANLTAFTMRGEWELEHLEAVLRIMPNITTLNIGGEIAHRFGYYDDTEASDILKSFVSILTQFPKLHDLYLPPSWSLGLGFDGGNPCGNAYDGKEGRTYGRTVARRGAEATEMAADIVLAELPNLKKFSVGGEQANLTSGDDGKLNATWPWTGRMTEWTYDMWPERRDWTDDLVEGRARGVWFPVDDDGVEEGGDQNEDGVIVDADVKSAENGEAYVNESEEVDGKAADDGDDEHDPKVDRHS